MLKSAFATRRRLILSGQSRIPAQWAEKQMQRIEYLCANGNALNVARKNAGVIRVLITKNYLNKFENLIKETK